MPKMMPRHAPRARHDRTQHERLHRPIPPGHLLLLHLHLMSYSIALARKRTEIISILARDHGEDVEVGLRGGVVRHLVRGHD